MQSTTSKNKIESLRKLWELIMIETKKQNLQNQKIKS
jgi:hypothetical protein